MQVTLSEWIAFNEQLAGLAKVGVPIEAGLRDLAAESDGPLRRLSLEVGRHLERGESLDTALATEIANFPPAYRGVVAAGLRSGNLGAALEAVSEGAKRIQTLRRTFAVASVYPLIIAVLAILLMTVVGVPLIWSMRAVYEQCHMSTAGTPGVLFRAADLWAVWWWTGLVLIGLLALWWWGSGGLRAVRLHGPLALVPGAGRLMRNCDQLAAAEMLSALINRDVPLGEALCLAAASVTRPDYQTLLRTWGEQVDRGERIEGRDPLGVALAESGDAASLRLGLAQTVVIHRELVRNGIWRITTLLPILLGVGIGGVIVLAYALGVIVPVTNLLNGLMINGGENPY